jgi:thiamine pyrophosphokinase
MKNRKAFLLLNGDEPSLLPNLGGYQFVCAADGAYNVLKSKDIVPDLVVGDFDSIGAVPPAIECVHKPDQNLTDFDKALTLLKERGFLNIDVYGASGKEHDHF